MKRCAQHSDAASITETPCVNAAPAAPDALQPDASQPDASQPDASQPDASQPDTIAAAVADRDQRGRFLRGHAPHGRLHRVNDVRALMLRTLTHDDIRDVIRVLCEKAKAGEAWAVKELLSRLIGRSQTVPEPESLMDHLRDDFNLVRRALDRQAAEEPGVAAHQDGPDRGRVTDGSSREAAVDEDVDGNDIADCRDPSLGGRASDRAPD